WIVTVAQHGAGLPTAAIGWGTGATALALLTLVVAAMGWLAPALLRRPATGLACCLVMIGSALVSPRDLGWPPGGWVLVACDVGQGDALVVNTGPASAMVVDVGPDPLAVDRCLGRLGVERVPLLVLTHFHADHISGFRAVLEGRRVDRIEVTTTLDPPDGVEGVLEAVSGASPTPVFAQHGETRVIGDVTVQTLWPTRITPSRGAGDGSSANDASVVLLVETAGLRLLLTGDVEPPSQGVLARDLPGLRVDVLKVPHHGSSHQDLPWLTSLEARLALVSVGEDNDYGHPSEEVLTTLTAAGVAVARTDLNGDLAVVVRGGEPHLVARGR
uniref:ComEC/Rec2 family competence protein n=1 Tax=Nocardioides sp. TaxID=35761 RepID=UPI003569438A